MNDPFLLSSWMKMCLGSFQREGVDIAQVMTLAEVMPGQLDQPLCSIALANRLFSAALQLSDNPALGINAGRSISPTTFSAIGYAAIASDNLLQGFRIIERFSPCMTDIIQLYMIEEADQVCFGFDPAYNGIDLHFIGYETVVCMLTRICRQLQAGPAQIKEVHLVRSRPADWQRYERYFKAPVRWGSDCYRLTFDRDYFMRPNIHANAILREENFKLAEQYYGSLMGTSRFTHTVRRLINQSLTKQDLSLTDIAHAMNVSERSLQRQLSVEGASFRQLLDDVKKEAARRYLQSSSLSVCQVAYQLGFNDSGNFSRAFKRWYGCAPHQYRQGAVAA